MKSKTHSVIDNDSFSVFSFTLDERYSIEHRLPSPDFRLPTSTQMSFSNLNFIVLFIFFQLPSSVLRLTSFNIFKFSRIFYPVIINVS